jgi:hypothetical protein
VFQFKQAFVDRRGTWRQDPQWWLNMSRASLWGRPASGLRPDHPVLHVNHSDNDYGSYRPRLLAAPVGRWFDVRAELYPGERIDWFIDGRHLDTSRHPEWPVGITEPRATGWLFGVGHYGGIGTLYADDVSFTARS